MKSAVLEKPVATGALDTDRLRAFVLVRIACAADGLSKTDLAADLAPLVAHRLAPAQWRSLVEREIVALADAGLASVGRHAPAAERSRHRPRRHLPGAQGCPAALLGGGARGAPPRQGARARARVGQAPQGVGRRRRTAGGAGATRLRPQGPRCGDAVATARGARRSGAGARLRQSDQGRARRQARPLRQGRAAARGPARQEAARFRHRRPPHRRPCGRARGRGPGRPRHAAPGRAAALPRRARQAGRAAAARRRKPPSHARGWSRRRLRRPRSGGRISRASPRRCAGTLPPAPRAGPATARPTSATSGISWPRSARSGASRRSSSSACSSRRTVPAAWRSPTPT